MWGRESGHESRHCAWTNQLLYPHLRLAVPPGSFDKAIEANVKIQAELLSTSSTVIRDDVKSGSLKVASGVYDLGTGKVTLS